MAARSIAAHISTNDLRQRLCDSSANILQIPIPQLTANSVCPAAATSAGSCAPIVTEDP